MLNSSISSSRHRNLGPPRSESSVPGSTKPGACQPPAFVPFVYVSANLRRLMLQAEITAPRLHIATVEGEAGAGKHLFAQNIHRQSRLAHLPFRRRDAREWLANEADPATLNGTLYLDRVDLLAPLGQGLLLSLLKSMDNDPPAPQRFLLLASTHTSLRQLAGETRFLPDLAFRLTAVRFSLPPLRDHREDIAPITQALVERICHFYQQPNVVLAQGTLPSLLQHTWPGNVRELASTLESAILDSSTGIIRPGDLALYIPRPTAPSPHALDIQPAGQPGDLSLDAAIRRHIELVLDLHHGNKLRAARQLGISRSTLYRLLAGGTLSPQTTQPS